jgi:hypothetical protein
MSCESVISQGSEMADSSKDASLLAEIARLRQQQLEDLGDATYVGWTHEERATHEQRANRIAELFRQIERHDDTS